MVPWVPRGWSQSPNTLLLATFLYHILLSSDCITSRVTPFHLLLVIIFPTQVMWQPPSLADPIFVDCLSVLHTVTNISKYLLCHLAPRLQKPFDAESFSRQRPDLTKSSSRISCVLCLPTLTLTSLCQPYWTIWSVCTFCLISQTSHVWSSNCSLLHFRVKSHTQLRSWVKNGLFLKASLNF